MKVLILAASGDLQASEPPESESTPSKRFQSLVDIHLKMEWKIVVVDGVQPFYTDESGISFVGLMDFMLNKDVLSPTS